jgi:glycine C-acetyltransferase
MSETAIVPVILRDEMTTAMLARGLRDHGILVTPVMFPAVPQGSARLRLCVTAAHSTPDLAFALDAFSQLRR